MIKVEQVTIDGYYEKYLARGNRPYEYQKVEYYIDKSFKQRFLYSGFSYDDTLNLRWSERCHLFNQSYFY